MASLKKTILLTGATGFLGSRVLSLLVKAGFSIIVLIRKNSDLKRISDFVNNSVNDVSIVELNAKNDKDNKDDKDEKNDKDENALKKVFENNDIDYVIHLATQYGGDKSSIEIVLDSNLLFPIKILEYGLEHGLKGFINTDTFYPPHYSYLNEYARSKHMFSKCLEVYASKIKIINLKLQHVYGVYDQSFKFIPSTIRFLLNSKEDLLLTKGDQKRDFIYVDDVARAYINALTIFEEMTVQEHCFDIGSGASMSLSNVVKRIAKILDVPDSRLRFGALPYRENEIMTSCADSNSFSELTGWQPQVKLNQGLEKTIEWIRNNNDR